MPRDAPSLLALSHSTWDPASRFRVLQYLPHLERLGWHVAHAPNRPARPAPRGQSDRRRRLDHWLRKQSRKLDIRRARRFDLAWVNRDLLASDPRWEERLAATGRPLVFDFDDALFLSEGRPHFARALAAARWVLAGNETLAAAARRFTDRVSILPTTIETGRYRVATHAPGRLRIGWCGSDLSIHQTLAPRLPLLAQLQRRLGFRFVVMSWPRPKLSTELDWDFAPWSPDAEARLGDWFDLGLMPLEDTPFQAAKCGCKLLQYLACGLPAVATPLGINAAFLAESGGGLPATSDEDWETAILRYGDPAIRAEAGARGRAWVERHYSLERWLPEIDRLFRSLLDVPCTR